MLYVLRPSAGYLALVRATSEAETLILIAGPNVALPDAAFWARIRALGLDKEMETENPERWARVQANGVGELRQEKTLLARSGLTRANAHSKAPDAGTIEDMTDSQRPVVMMAKAAAPEIVKAEEPELPATSTAAKIVKYSAIALGVGVVTSGILYLIGLI